MYLSPPSTTHIDSSRLTCRCYSTRRYRTYRVAPLCFHYLDCYPTVSAMILSLTRRLSLKRPLLTPSALVAACRQCSGKSQGSVPASPTIAPKKPRRRIVAKMDVSDLVNSVPSDPGAHAELSTAELERKMEEWSKMNPAQLEEAIKKFEQQEDASSKVLEEDSLYQMDVSIKPRSSGAVRVFWKDVDVVPLEAYKGWYGVTVDGHKVKAFESTQVLAIPSEAMACCCAQEYAEQTDFLNKLLMPMTDMCSGALHVAPQMIPPRVDYLMSFFQNDNMYFRAAPIAAQQDKMIQPIADWFSRVYEVDVPRIVGIGHPHITPHDTMKVRDALLAMNMNPYQIVSLCVAAQFTSSLLLPLAMFNGIVDLPTALQINRAEEGHNISEAGMVEGYHDIREADVVTKICACATTWRIMSSVPLSKCMEVPRLTAMDEAEAV